MSLNTPTFQQQCLQAHNDYRSKHGVPPLTLSKELCDYAQQWANNNASRGVMQHRSQRVYGENIYYCFGVSSVSGKAAVDAWYSEIRQHTFGREPRSLATGHFTQIVWKDSKNLGVGVAKNNRGQIFVVCNYNPPGNYVGRYSLSVPPVGGFRR